MKNGNKLSRRHLLRDGLAVSASMAASSLMGRAEALFPAVEEPANLQVKTPREKLLMDFGWKFTLGHGSDPAKDQGFGADTGEFVKGGIFHIANTGFDDSKWRTLNLPHDWGIELPYVHDDKLRGRGYKPLGRSYPETSVGWYRHTFELPASDLGRRIHVEFDGVLRDAQVLFNGYMIGRNDNGYCPFSFDLTDFANYGGRNSLVVRADASYGDGWFYEGAGIYRHVWLTKTAPVFLGKWESYVRSEVQGASATLSLGTVVMNASNAQALSSVHWNILDPAGKSVASISRLAKEVSAGGSETFTASVKLAEPRLWSPDSPLLYTAVVTVVADGTPVDSDEVTFGVRSTRFDVNKGFLLNGKPLKIKGTCNHQDHAGVGAALPDRMQTFRMGILKDMGSNAVRTSHNMPTPEWVEACDRMGMMMMCETRLASSNPEGMAAYTAMVKRYRNSPSIILWSIANEDWKLQFAPEGERIARSMIALSRQLDPTRLCAAAINGDFGKGLSRAVDVEGFNYNVTQIDKYHADHPTQALIGSETASTISTRGIYSTDKLRNWVSAYDKNTPSWAQTAEGWWKFYSSREFLPGGFAWTGFDYRGEPTPYAWPSISSQFGIVDLCGFPKDNFFYYKSWWSSQPVLHLFPHWNWEARLGEPVEVWVHSNLDYVELLVNGKSLGAKAVQPLTHLEWSVKYEPGVLEARGFKNGGLVLTERCETAGPVAGLRLVPDRAKINADGEDLAIVRVEAVDAQGRFVATAESLVEFKITGAGTFVGTGNGDPNCQEPDLEPRRSLFNGLAMVIVQAAKLPGTITIEAFGKDSPTPKVAWATAVVETQSVTLRPSL